MNYTTSLFSEREDKMGQRIWMGECSSSKCAVQIPRTEWLGPLGSVLECLQVLSDISFGID